MVRGIVLVAAAALVAACKGGDSTPAPPGDPACTGAIARVSVGPGGAQANGASAAPGMTWHYVAQSADGRVVAFASEATNLVAGDGTAFPDVFVHDRATGETTRVSVASDGTPSNATSYDPSISADGRVVAFWSWGNDLVAGDTNGYPDVFVHDRATGETARVSVSTGGAQGDGGSSYPVLSATGRYVAFVSSATNLVAADGNGARDVFVHDRVAGTTVRASVGAGGAEGNAAVRSDRPAISGDGSRVSFVSDATNLAPQDTNGVADVFVRDLVAGTTVRASVSSAGAQGDGVALATALSSSGRYVAFTSWAANLVPGDGNASVDAFVRDLDLGTTSRASVTSSGAEIPRGAGVFVDVSADGSTVAFVSDDDTVAGGTGQLWKVLLRSGGATRRVDLADGGAAPASSSFNPALSSDGRYVAFWSEAPDLVASDTNGVADVFVSPGCWE